MKRLVIVFLLILSCKETPKAVEVTEQLSKVHHQGEAIVLDIYDYDGLEPLINKDDGKVHVVNFWATWCAPCVKELPYFEKINSDYKNKNVEVLLVSLDFPRQYDSKLKPFLKKKNIQSKVVCFDDVDQNRWIPAIDTTWSGALPATIIYKGNKRQFYEKSFNYEELETEVKLFLN
ncbi:TlpA disulfide reductase family protein [Winogradskyella jejuensis]|uniref:AhpC/TSA family protein n=1 Tax=Winogradskyella jejuensis TaxID=1089305 RepID=A0A1M5KDH3_9FLAO|nr:TlpA disulfide reductase family protein [Winogradskyella jejuensis]SHG50886.1 AhpC/TSA family protein [Winogradskyella jejuensis]